MPNMGKIKKPAPFQRPRIDLGGPPRDWRQVQACKINFGDIIAGSGKVHLVDFEVRRPLVVIHAGEGNVLVKQATDLVLVFTTKENYDG